MRPITVLAVSLSLSIGAGIALEKAGVPDLIADRVQDLIDTKTRHVARIMTDEVNNRRKELEAVKA